MNLETSTHNKANSIRSSIAKPSLISNNSQLSKSNIFPKNGKPTILTSTKPENNEPSEWWHFWKWFEDENSTTAPNTNSSANISNMDFIAKQDSKQTKEFEYFLNREKILSSQTLNTRNSHRIFEDKESSKSGVASDKKRLSERNLNHNSSSNGSTLKLNDESDGDEISFRTVPKFPPTTSIRNSCGNPGRFTKVLFSPNLIQKRQKMGIFITHPIAKNSYGGISNQSSLAFF